MGDSTVDCTRLSVLRERGERERERERERQRLSGDYHPLVHTYTVQSLEWYDHPEARKYLLSAMTNPTSSSTSMAPQDSHSVKHILSPHSPGATPRSSQDHGSKKTLAHINSLAQQEVEHALKDLEITNQVSGACILYVVTAKK